MIRVIHKGRGLFSAGICLLSFMAFMVSGCSSVDKALYSVTDSVTSVDRVTGQRSVNMVSRPAQIQKSNSQTDQLLAQNYTQKGLKLNAELDAKAYARLQAIFKRVHQVSHMKDEPWTVFLIPEDSFNAFVTGGSYVIVHHGLMKDVQSDDEIAYIIGHEIAHVAANHVYESQGYNIGAMLAGSKSAKRGSFQAAFTHENEREADRIGLLYAALAGYNPEAGASSWERMGDEYGYHATTYKTHPIAKERAAENAKNAAVFKQYYQPGVINPNHQAILRNNPIFGVSQNAGPAPGEGGGVGALLGAAVNVLGAKQQAKTEEARQTRRIQFIQYVGQNLRLVSRTQLNANTARFTLQYTGEYALSELVIRGQTGKAVAIAKIEQTIPPKGQFNADFAFKDVTLSDADIRAIQLQMDYAESPQIQ